MRIRRMVQIATIISMRAIVDVCYRAGRATAACIVFSHWKDREPASVSWHIFPAAAPYRAGRFYQRELPCILAVLRKAGCEFETIVIDGYVHLEEKVGKGLGVQLYESLVYDPVIIGVAKSPLIIAKDCVPIYRGWSRRPLFISSLGCPVQVAARHIEAMHGHYRIPTLLRLADQLARQEEAPGLPDT